MTTLEELTRAIDQGRDEEVRQLLVVLMMDIRQQGETDAQAEFERGLAFILRAHDLAVQSAIRLTSR